MENQAEKTFDELTNEEKLVLLALYINHPFPQNADQIERTISAYGWNKLSSDEIDELRITLVKARYN